jgi:predicted membrane protein
VATSNSEKSWWARTFGRSVIAMLVGTFFEKKANAASIVAIILVFSICYVIVVKEKFEYMSFLLNIVFVVIGYYFGAKQESVTNGDE